MAGAGGLEPPNAGIKTRCLNRLATPQHIVIYFRARMSRPNRKVRSRLSLDL